MFSVNIKRLHFHQDTHVTTNVEATLSPYAYMVDLERTLLGCSLALPCGLHRLRIRVLIVNTRNL